jgi:hypothetical protein
VNEREARRAAIRECIQLVEAYDEKRHRRLYVASMLSQGNLNRVPKGPQAMIAAGLRRLLDTEPQAVACTVVEPLRGSEEE